MQVFVGCRVFSVEFLRFGDCSGGSCVDRVFEIVDGYALVHLEIMSGQQRWALVRKNRGLKHCCVLSLFLFW